MHKRPPMTPMVVVLHKFDNLHSVKAAVGSPVFKVVVGQEWSVVDKNNLM